MYVVILYSFEIQWIIDSWNNYVGTYYYKSNTYMYNSMSDFYLIVNEEERETY